MQYLHPLIMIILLSALYFIRQEGKKALAINPKSPEADQYQVIILKHRKLAYGLTILILIGLIAGVLFSVYGMGVKTPFANSRGHGYLGAVLLGLLLSNIFVGLTVKKTSNPKSRKKALQLHYALFYTILAVSALALITGIVMLFSGPAV